MAESCPICGAAWTTRTCDETFYEMLDFESVLPLVYSVREIGDVHFFTVACYMIQHDKYSAEARAGVVKSIERVLSGEIDALTLAKEIRAGAQQGARDYKVTGSTGERVAWSLTIIDAAGGFVTEGYAERVHAWARATLEDLRG